MADSMSVTNTGAQKVDLERWKKLSAQEIIKEESKGEEIPAEIVNWAQQMAAFAKIPDDVTYEQVDGDTGLDALDKLGITPEEAGLAAPEADNAEAPAETEEPDAVKDPAKASDVPPEQDEDIFMNPQPGQAADKTPPKAEEEKSQDEALALADQSLTTDSEEIRKRKVKKGIQ